MKFYGAKNFRDAYMHINDYIILNGVHVKSAFGYAIEARNLTYTINNPFDGFVEGFPKETKTPNVEYAEAFANWVLSGNPEMPQALIELNPKASEFNYDRSDLEEFDLPENFSIFYGPRIKHQLPHIVKELKQFKNTRRAVISILDGMSDNLFLTHLREGDLKKVEYPCTVSFTFHVTGNKLDITCIMRSQNMVNVWPYDFYIARKLLKHVADETGYEPGKVHAFISSAHIYLRDFNQITDTIEKWQLKRS